MKVEKQKEILRERERERNALLFFLVQKAMNVENRRGADVKFVLQPF